MITLTPTPTSAPRLVMRALDGRTYSVTNAAQARTMARDLQRMAAAYARLLGDVQRKMRAAGLSMDVRTPSGAWHASLQAHTGQVIEYAGWASQTYGLTYVPGAGGVEVPAGAFADGVFRATDAAGLRLLGRKLTDDARGVLDTLPVQSSQAIVAPPVPPTGAALRTGTISALAPLPMATTAILYGVGIITAGVVVYQLGRTALSWYSPEGRATYEAFAAGRDAIATAYEAQIADCDDDANPEACRERATTAFVEQLGAISEQAGSASWQTIVLRVGALAVGGYVLAKVLR